MTTHIDRRDFLKWAGLGVLGLAAGIRVRAAEKARKPNFLVIVADDMGFSDAGCYGGEIATPVLDGLAAGGLRFTQFYSTGRCWPSRSCLMTGYYAQQIRMDPPRGRLPAWARTMPHRLKPLGYRCYHSGKWHVNGAPKVVADGGFDRSYVIDDHDRFFAPKQARLDDQSLPPVPENSGFYLTTAIADYALGFLKDHEEKSKDAPFLLYLAFTSPHFPLQAKPEDIERYKGRYDEGWDTVREKRWKRQKEMKIVDGGLAAREPDVVPGWNLKPDVLREKIGPGEAPYAVAWSELTDEQRKFQSAKMSVHAAMIDRMDREIGRVLERLKAMGALDNTVVLFMSDNGASAEQIIRGDQNDPAAPPGSAKSFLCLGPGWSTAANTPFRLHKHWNHEGGIASPLIVNWPASKLPAGELRHTPGHFIDILPTLVELAGGAVPPPAATPDAPPVAGRSLAAALPKDADVPRDFLYWHHEKNRAIRIGDWKLVSRGDDQTDANWELYDMRSDRIESKDLAAAKPDKVKELRELWHRSEDQYRLQAGPPEPGTEKPKPAKTGRKQKTE